MPNVATKIAISPASGSLELGNTLQLTASLTDINGNSVSPTASFSWASSNPSLASVSSSGLVTVVPPVADQLNTGGQVSISVKYPYGVADAIEADCVLTITVATPVSAVVVLLSPPPPAMTAGFGGSKLFPAGDPWPGDPIIE